MTPELAAAVKEAEDLHKFGAILGLGNKQILALRLVLDALKEAQKKEGAAASTIVDACLLIERIITHIKANIENPNPQGVEEQFEYYDYCYFHRKLVTANH